MIVNYKTDAVENEDQLDKLIQFYTPQVEMYQNFWENITNNKVHEAGTVFHTCGPLGAGAVRLLTRGLPIYQAALTGNCLQDSPFHRCPNVECRVSARKGVSDGQQKTNEPARG
ncbi:MAG: hypothetical protein K6U74_08490 [Firmicutes bacterium]|nr:hypothetical protein [Bacillota bacterium]